MGNILLFPTIVLVLVAPFILLNTYLLAWICGPAIRHAGKCWEEGRMRAVLNPEERRYLKAVGETIGAAECPARAVVAAPAIPKQTTPEIPTPDSGHRWLGSPTGRK